MSDSNPEVAVSFPFLTQLFFPKDPFLFFRVPAGCKPVDHDCFLVLWSFSVS